MKLVKDYPRRLTAVIWLTCGCLFLWLFSLARVNQPSWEGFFHFSFMLVGGGAVYHMLTGLLTIRFNHQTRPAWRKLLVSMSLVMATLLSVTGLIAVDKYIWPHNGVLALGSLFAGYVALWPQISNVSAQFNRLRSYNSSKRARKPRAA